MAEQELLLKAPDGTLRLRTIAANGWTEVSLEADAGFSRLGAEDRAVLLNRLRNGLTSRSTSGDGFIAGRPVRYVLTLAEKHATLYFRDPGHVSALVVQEDPDGRILAVLELSDATRRRWLDQLTAWGEGV